MEAERDAVEVKEGCLGMGLEEVEAEFEEAPMAR